MSCMWLLDIVKNGKIHNGRQNHKCRGCGWQFVESPQWRKVSDETKTLIDKLLLERLLLAGIARVVGISEPWLQGYVHEKFGTIRREVDVRKKGRLSLTLRYDEVWSFVGCKANKHLITKVIGRLTSYFLLLLLTLGAMQAQSEWPHVVLSKDNTPISYEIVGAGQPTLVFIHGWSCDSRYWRAQIPHFSKNHRIVTLDLAGHGHSGLTRSQYTMKHFGEDVHAVTKAVGDGDVILIGHSMGGAVIAEAARLMPDRVIGLIGVDTLQNVEYPMTREALKELMAPLEKDFPAGTRQFAGEMILPYTDPQLREWILADMSAAPPAVALSAMENMMFLYITGEAAKLFDKIPLPVVAVNADLWPIDYQANRQHMASFEAIVLEGADHFLMMNRPAEFNPALEKAIQMVLEKSAK